MHYYKHSTCYICGDFLIWFNDHWYCPSCDKEVIERLKYSFVVQELERKQLKILQRRKMKND